MYPLGKRKRFPDLYAPKTAGTRMRKGRGEKGERQRKGKGAKRKEGSWEV